MRRRGTCLPAVQLDRACEATTNRVCKGGTKERSSTHCEAVAAARRREFTRTVSSLSRGSRGCGGSCWPDFHLSAPESFYARPAEFPAEHQREGRLLRRSWRRAHKRGGRPRSGRCYG